MSSNEIGAVVRLCFSATPNPPHRIAWMHKPGPWFGNMHLPKCWMFWNPDRKFDSPYHLCPASY